MARPPVAPAHVQAMLAADEPEQFSPAKSIDQLDEQPQPDAGANVWEPVALKTLVAWSQHYANFIIDGRNRPPADGLQALIHAATNEGERRAALMHEMECALHMLVTRDDKQLPMQEAFDDVRKLLAKLPK